MIECEQRSREWFAERAKFAVTGSEAGVVVGVSKHARAKDLWLKKTNQLARDDADDGAPSSDACDFGTRFERAVIDTYALITGNAVEPVRVAFDGPVVARDSTSARFSVSLGAGVVSRPPRLSGHAVRRQSRRLRGRLRDRSARRARSQVSAVRDVSRLHSGSVLVARGSHLTVADN